MGLQRLTDRRAEANRSMAERVAALGEQARAAGNGRQASPVTTRRGSFTALRCDTCRHRRVTASPDTFRDAECPCRGCAGTMREAGPA